MAGVVFISAREDAFEAQSRTADLERALYPVEVRVSLGFWPESFREHLPSLIGDVTAVIVLWSLSSLHNPVIRKYADIAEEKGNLVPMLSSLNLPWPTSVEGKSIGRYEHHQIPKSRASSLFPPWVTEDHAPPSQPSQPPPLPRAVPWNVALFGENARGRDVVLFVLPGIIIVGTFLWGATRGTLSIELVGWGVLCAALVNLMRGLRV